MLWNEKWKLLLKYEIYDEMMCALWAVAPMQPCRAYTKRQSSFSSFSFVLVLLKWFVQCFFFIGFEFVRCAGTFHSFSWSLASAACVIMLNVSIFKARMHWAFLTGSKATSYRFTAKFIQFLEDDSSEWTVLFIFACACECVCFVLRWFHLVTNMWGVCFELSFTN